MNPLLTWIHRVLLDRHGYTDARRRHPSQVPVSPHGTRPGPNTPQPAKNRPERHTGTNQGKPAEPTINDCHECGGNGHRETWKPNDGVAAIVWEPCPHCHATGKEPAQ